LNSLWISNIAVFRCSRVEIAFQGLHHEEAFQAVIYRWQNKEKESTMEAIQPCTILENYKKVIDEIRDGEPVVLTHNGVGKVVLVNIDEWQRRQAEMWLLTQLNNAENEFGEGEDIDEFARKYKLGTFSA
jgi:prevent-host-death family protein